MFSKFKQTYIFDKIQVEYLKKFNLCRNIKIDLNMHFKLKSNKSGESVENSIFTINKISILMN